MSDTPNPPPVIWNNVEAKRFELVVDGGPAFLDYVIDGTTILYTHAEVPPALEGRGLGTQLAHFAMEFARENGYTVRALCPFVDGYVKRHPEYHDITLGY